MTKIRPATSPYKRIETGGFSMRWFLGIFGTLASVLAGFAGGAYYMKLHGWPIDENMLTVAQHATLDTVRWVCGGATYLVLLILTWGKPKQQGMTDGIVFIGPQEKRAGSGQKVISWIVLFLFVLAAVKIYNAINGQ
jgi:hypothetical protein